MDPKELQVEVKQQIQWILRYIEQNQYKQDVTKDKLGLQDMEKLREMTLKLPDTIARNSMHSAMTSNNDANMISQKE